MCYKLCGPRAGSNFLLTVSPCPICITSPTSWRGLPDLRGGIHRISQSPAEEWVGAGGREAIARAPASTDLSALATVVAAVATGLRRDPALREHLQTSGCLGKGHGKVQEKPRLLKTIPESH